MPTKRPPYSIHPHHDETTSRKDETHLLCRSRRHLIQSLETTRACSHRASNITSKVILRAGREHAHRVLRSPKLYQAELDSLPPTPEDTSLPNKHHTRHHIPPHQHTGRITPTTQKPGPSVTASMWAQHCHLHLHAQTRPSPNPDCPHLNSAEVTIEHILLHCPALQVHRDF